MSGNLHQQAGQRQAGSQNNWVEWCHRHERLSGLEELKELRAFNIESPVYEAVKNNDINRVQRFPACLNEQNYYQTLQNLMRADEFFNSINLRKFDRSEQRVSPEFERTGQEHGRIRHWSIRVDGLSDGKPNLTLNDLAILMNPDNPKAYKMASIARIQGDDVVLKIDRLGDSRQLLEGLLDVSFISRSPICEYYESGLERVMDDAYLKRIIFEENSGDGASTLSSVKISPKPMVGSASKRLARLNGLQYAAVTGILAAECRPKPYILFGPPKAGKTHIIVEAIVQIYARDSWSKILFCAHSNDCADEMVNKLKEVDLIQSDDVQRLSAGDPADDANFSRILITTIMKSGSFIKNKFEYDYVFIDEAGHASEPDTLLPICSLKYDGCLVLAGDTKQFGPTVQYEQAAKSGLNRSMLERILEFKVYQRDRRANSYDGRYITKLLFCYGYDPRVLAISSKLFYDDQLVCLSETPKPILEKMQLSEPVQFWDVRGTEFQPTGSSSWKNEVEAERCVDLVIRLYDSRFESDQLGVMSPFKAQANLITERLKHRLREKFETRKSEFRQESESRDRAELDKTISKWTCEIGTVEAFQRIEREIIIVSTVRSTKPSNQMDFIDEPRRFNVAMSRAKWLLFVVGNKEVLDSHRNWSKFTRQAARYSGPVRLA